MLIILVLSTENTLFAQESDLDDLSKKTTTELLQEVLEITPEKHTIYEQELLKRSIDDAEKIDFYTEVGRAFIVQGNYELSDYYLRKGIAYAERVQDSQKLSRLYTLLGNSKLMTWHNQEALDAYYKALEFTTKQEGIDDRVVIIQPNIAIIRRRMKQLDQALDACNEALAIIPYTAFNNQHDHVNLLTIVSEVHLDLQHYDTVLKYVNQGLSMSNELDYKRGLIDLYTKKGAVYFYKKDYEQSLQYLKTADRIYRESSINNKTFVININYFLANCYVEKKEYQKAINQLQLITGITDTDERKNYTRLINAYKLMAASYESIGDDKNSSDWYRKYGELYKKYQDSKDELVNTIYEKDTSILGKQIETLEDQKARQKRTALYFLILLIAVSGLCIFIVYWYKRKQRSNKASFDKLLEKVNELEKSSKQKSKPKEPSRELIIDDQKVIEVLKGLKRLEQQEFFLHTDCSLRTMAKKVKTNATYLSKIINTHKGVSYNDYINNLRIDYAVNRIKSDKKFRSFSIKSIATELGYKSDYSFAKHFKSKTGINPSYYIKRIEEI
ncbi:helix-turn-helix domain-containing protein [Dokdonia ponticola]|uniref:Helix-turn-helix domain-containing protein n=1 Tax=Dokdonia ponticola TaxID=2041041 RepID=A0ABV9I0D9_9FLAO